MFVETQVYVLNGINLVTVTNVENFMLSQMFTDINKNLAIANRSRASCAHNTSRSFITPWPWNITGGSLKVTGNGTIGYIIHDLLLVELFDVEYYRDLKMSVRGHSRSLKMVPFESWGTVMNWPSIETVAESLAISEIFSVKEWPYLEIWVWGHSRSLKMAPFDRSLWLSIGPPL